MKRQRSNRPKAAKRSHYKVTNWRAYNQSLKQRGSLELWIDDKVQKHWYYTGASQRGAQYRYSDSCIQMACIIKEVYHLGYWQTQGFVESLIARLGWNVQVPDYSVINRRHKNLHIAVKGADKAKKYLVIDSTGVKVYGEGEWKVRQHGYSRRRTWRKLHLGVDEATNELVAAVVTT